jgi:hypothetical protein
LRLFSSFVLLPATLAQRSRFNAVNTGQDHR